MNDYLDPEFEPQTPAILAIVSDKGEIIMEEMFGNLLGDDEVGPN